MSSVIMLLFIERLEHARVEGAGEGQLPVIVCPETAIYMSSYCYISVLMLLYVCPDTVIYVTSYCYISSVLILPYVSAY